MKSILSETAANIFRSDQRNTPRIYIEILYTDQSSQYLRTKNRLQQLKARTASFLGTSIDLNERNVIEVNYEEARWLDGEGTFNISYALHSTRWNLPVIAGDKIVCYMWHDHPLGNVRLRPPQDRDMKFVGIVSEVTTHIGREGTVNDVHGKTLISLLKEGSISLAVRGDEIYAVDEDGNDLKDLDDNKIVIGYEEIKFRDIFNALFKQLIENFPSFEAHFKPINLRVNDSENYNFNDYWKDEFSFGIESSLLRFKIRNGIFNASGSPYDILLDIVNKLRNLYGKRGIEFFVEPKKVNNQWKGVITVRKTPKKTDILTGLGYKNPRSLIGMKQQKTQLIFGRNIRKSDLLDSIEPIFNSIVIQGKIEFEDDDTVSDRLTISSLMENIKSSNIENMNTRSAYEITNETSVANKIKAETRPNGRLRSFDPDSKTDKPDKIRIFGVKSISEFKNRVITLKVINVTSALKYGERIVPISDENISSFSEALNLAIDSIAIYSKPAHRGYTTFLDSKGDKLHLWNNVIELLDHRKKGIDEWAFQSLAGLSPIATGTIDERRQLSILSDPRSKLGIFTKYKFYYHNKISIWWSSQGITTKVAFVNERRPGGEDVLSDFRSLVRDYVTDLEKEKPIQVLVGTVIRTYSNITEEASEIIVRERQGRFIVSLDDLSFVDRWDTRSRQQNSLAGREVEAVIGDSLYMINRRHMGMYSKPDIGDRVIIFKIGTNYVIIGRISSFIGGLTSLPPFLIRADELAIAHPKGACFHIGDILYNDHEHTEEFANISLGGTRFISLVGQKYKKFNQFINFYNPTGDGQVYYPSRGLIRERIGNQTTPRYNRANYNPPHPLGKIGIYQFPLNNCYWLQTHTGGRIFLGEVYAGINADGISEMDQRFSFLQTIAKTIQILGGEKWRPFSIDGGKDGFDTTGVPGEGDLAILNINENEEKIQIGFLAKGDADTKLILIQLKKDELLINYQNRSIKIDGSNIELENGSTKLTVSATEVNIT